MAEAVLMPKVGISVETCIITEWYKQQGDSVDIGEALFGYETDKSTMDCESTAAGTLLERFYENGDEVPVLVPVCAIGQPGEDAGALRASAGLPAAPAAGPAQAAAAEAAAAPAAVEQGPIPAPAAAAAQGAARVSPRARAAAERMRLDPGQAAPTGPDGRVIERDVQKLADAVGYNSMSGASAAAAPAQAATAAPARPAADGPEYEDIKYSGIRKVISQSMTASLANIPQLTHNFSFDATALLALRAQLKKSGEELSLPNITLNDMVMYAIARTLPLYPALNAHMPDGLTLRQFRDVHLGMAVDTPKGLLVPVIKNAGLLSLAQLAAEAKRLGKAAQEGTLTPDDMAGGTFTVSNLGILGVESFTPVINPPQTGIMGVNAVVTRVREGQNGIETYPAMGLSLTYDHRAIDGAPASRFAHEVCKRLESFNLLLAI